MHRSRHTLLLLWCFQDCLYKSNWCAISTKLSTNAHKALAFLQEKHLGSLLCESELLLLLQRHVIHASQIEFFGKFYTMIPKPELMHHHGGKFQPMVCLVGRCHITSWSLNNQLKKTLFLGGTVALRFLSPLHSHDFGCTVDSKNGGQLRPLIREAKKLWISISMLGGSSRKYS